MPHDSAQVKPFLNFKHYFRQPHGEDGATFWRALHTDFAFVRLHDFLDDT
jgi:hypothetical protein